jgi:ribose-phosphate pyrophosphokinase
MVVVEMEFVLGCDSFAKMLAVEMGCQFREFREEYYPDGEPCPRVLADYEELTGRDVLVASRLKSPVTSFGILSYLHTLNRVTSCLSDEHLYGAGSVDVLLPYFVLGRQDHNPRTDKSEFVRSRDKGKDVGYMSILRDLEARCVRRLLTFTPHFDRSGEGSQLYHEVGPGIEVYRLLGVHALGRHFKDRLNPDTIIINPDMGAGKLAAELADLTGTKFREGLEKKRVTDREVEFDKKKTLDAEDRDVVVVDDIASSGSTLVGAVDMLENPGTISLTVVHAVLPELSRPDRGFSLVRSLLAQKRISEFVATDTIESEYSRASIIPDVANFYRTHG